MQKNLAAGFAAAALLCGLIPLIGWLFDRPELRGLGLGYPLWPWTAVGYLGGALALLAALSGDRRLARLFFCVPLMLGVLFLLQRLSGVDLGLERALFPDQLAGYAEAHPGRTSLNPSLCQILLGIGGWLALGPGRRAREIGAGFGGAVVLLATLAILVLLFTLDTAASPRILGSSLPAALAAMLLGLSLFFASADFGWIRQAVEDKSERRVLLRLIPVILLAPVVPALLEQWIPDRVLPAAMTGPLVVFGNILIISALVLWAISHIARKQSALHEVSGALGSGTIVLTRADGTITHWSRGCEELYGFTAAQAVGTRKYELLQSRCEQRWSQSPPRDTGLGAQELVEVRSDGTEVAVLERTHPVGSPGREPVFALSLTDITMAMEALAALRSSEERLALATSAHELGIFEWEASTGIIDWSPGTEARLGFRTGALARFDAFQAEIEPEDARVILDTVAHTVASRAEKFSYRFRLRNPRSSVKAVEGSARTFYDRDGNLLRTIGIILDVTEREEREGALRAREAQLRSILETVPDAMIVIDEQGTVLEFSKAAEDMWGYRAADVVGKNFSLLAPADARENYLRALTTFGESGDTHFVGRVVSGNGEAADGRRFPIEIRTGMARTDGEVLFTIFFREISDRLTAAERLSDLNAELAHVSRQSAMSELAADLAHELNQPLSATANFLAAARMLIDRGGETERVSDLLRMGSEQTLRAGEIIRRLREFMAKREVDMRVESLERTVRDAVELVLVGTGQFHIRLSYEFDPEARLIFADRIQVQQVLVNLLRNAMDALRSSPQHEREIVLATHRLEDDMVEIEVRDSGPGIPEAVLRQLYSRFVTTKDRAGMGIGLSISRRIIEAHGGTLSAENRAEGGATFRFTLPAMEQVGEEE